MKASELKQIVGQEFVYTPNMRKHIILGGEKTACCTIKECNPDSFSFNMDVKDNIRSKAPKLVKSLGLGSGRSTDRKADYIYFHPEKAAVVELKKIAGKNLDELNKFKSALNKQINPTIKNHLAALEEDYGHEIFQFRNKRRIKRIVIIQNSQKRTKNLKDAAWDKNYPELLRYYNKSISEEMFLR